MGQIDLSPVMQNLMCVHKLSKELGFFHSYFIIKTIQYKNNFAFVQLFNIASLFGQLQHAVGGVFD